ncbi:3'(2'),5'-bisphosphate nucleotidase 1 [Anopheles bellator]|uniref:3'(2'),5'-bisphosphate nucleotidase 1 n=1 Tax=Anopheles bellator TaxID=139047 RepID=UPI002648DC24|nr:3'(2'),5'-bisphosphate nucleotidase 1 [Anopheles bellator]XP_058058850.1 3'(2'),5'-bisphosphate nucleotidase 1 [Anopheles bellator]XP_058058851.1 3'(2'),5'-bisphosphate nucleotidase 1 [Anopheles bellator]
MASSTPLMMRLLGSSIQIAHRAGKIIREIMCRGDLGIVEKGKDDLQTEADRSAQRCIVASLARIFPGVTIIGEEGPSDLNVPDDWLITEGNSEFLEKHKCPEPLVDLKESEVVIWVDPLDGTSEYTQGFLERVTVLIGIAVNDRAVGGVIHQPYYQTDSGDLGRTIWGLKGCGSGGMVSVQPPSDRFLITTTRSHSNTIVQSALDALVPDEILRVGGAGYKVLQLLEGKAHAYVFASNGCKKWDTCAPEAVLEANGGTLTDMLGRHYQYGENVSFANSSGVLGTVAGVSHEDILSRIPDTVKQAMDKP